MYSSGARNWNRGNIEKPYVESWRNHIVTSRCSTYVAWSDAIFVFAILSMLLVVQHELQIRNHCEGRGQGIVAWTTDRNITYFCSVKVCGKGTDRRFESWKAPDTQRPPATKRVLTIHLNVPVVSDKPLEWLNVVVHNDTSPVIMQ